MKHKISPKIVSLIFSVLVICFVVAFYALGVWTEPTTTPPGGNVPAPLNVSSEEQTKQGNLVVNALGIVATGNALLVPNGNVGIGTTSAGQKLDVAGYVKGQTGLCIGDDCRTTWPSGGGGITSLSAGSGITLTPNPITSTGTISSNTTYLQRRVTGTCASNQAIRVINVDGTVSCVNIPPSAICTWNGRTYSTGAQCNPTPYCYVSQSNQVMTCTGDGSWISGWGGYPCPTGC